MTQSLISVVGEAKTNDRKCSHAVDMILTRPVEHRLLRSPVMACHGMAWHLDRRAWFHNYVTRTDGDSATA